MINRIFILLTFYILNMGMFQTNCFGADETVLSVNGHQSDDEELDEADESTEENENQERLRDLWSEFPEEVVQEKMGGLLQEHIGSRAEETTLQSKCLLNNAVPLRINNVSDFNVLIETDEPNLGKIRRIKQVIKSGEEGVYCAPFKRSTRVIISTEVKSKRDTTLLEGNAQLKAVDHQNLEDDNAKTLATRVALKDHQKAKLQRVQKGNIELKFKAKDFYSDLQEAIGNTGLILLIENDRDPGGQILVGVSKPANWDESSDEESEAESVEEQYDSEFVFMPRRDICKMDISLCWIERGGCTENYFYIETQKDDGKINRGYVSSSCKINSRKHRVSVFPMGTTEFRIGADTRFKTAKEIFQRYEITAAAGLGGNGFIDTTADLANSVDYKVGICGNEDVFCDFKFTRNNFLNQKAMFIGGLIDFSLSLKESNIKSGPFSYSEFSNFIRNTLNSRAPEIERAIIEGEVEWHEYKRGFLGFQTLSTSTSSKIPGKVFARENLSEKLLLSKKVSIENDPELLENIDVAYTLLRDKFQKLARVLFEDMDREGTIQNSSLKFYIKALLFSAFEYPAYPGYTGLFEDMKIIEGTLSGSDEALRKLDEDLENSSEINECHNTTFIKASIFDN